MPVLGTLASSVQKITGALEPIATAAGTGSSATITFSSIPSTYKHLQIRFTAKSTFNSDNANSIAVTFNGNTDSIYSRHSIYGSGTAAFADGSSSQTSMQLAFLAPSTSVNLVGVGIIDIHDYASTTKNKTMRYFGGVDTNGNAGIVSPAILGSGLSISTAAISSITFVCSTINFETSTLFSLYGIRG
jgi:hypothetical protein